MGPTLLSELEQFVEELRLKEAAKVYIIPDELMNAVKKAKHLEKLLHEIFIQATGSGGIHLGHIVRREFGMGKELADHIGQWARHSKEQFEDALHDAIDRAEIRSGNQGVFFSGTPTKAEYIEALELVQGIAHAVVRCQLNPRFKGADSYVEILELTLQFYALPHTYPDGSEINYRNLISAGRLHALAGGDDAVTEALKARARQWYQNSSFSFLERSEGYHTYQEVQSFLYLLTEEQLERLRNDFIANIHTEFQAVKAKPELHRAEYLKDMLETALRWRL